MDKVKHLSIDPAIIVIPSDVDRTLKSNKVPYSRYTNFEVLRDVLSSEDIKHWFSIIVNTTISGIQISNNIMELPRNIHVFPNCYSLASEFKEAHFDPYYFPSKDDNNEALEYLTSANAMTENFYSLFRDENVVFIIVEQGFMHKLEDPEFNRDFLKSYFRKLSEVLSITDLAKDKLHLKYISALTS